MKKAALIAIAILWSAHAGAESQYGIEVYPNAKADAAVAQSLKKMGFKNSAAYRTTDSVSKVVEFYRKQKFKELPGGDDRGGAFDTGKGVSLTIQNPWLEMSTGKLVKDTLISFVKKQ